MHPRHPALLAATVLLATSATVGTAAGQREVTVQAAAIQSLDVKMRAFAQGLAPAERAAWSTVLHQAAAAPADNLAGVPVRATFYEGCGCTSGSPGAIIVQGGRTGIIVQGGRTNNGAVTRAAGVGHVTGAGPTRPGDPAAIGPKQEDPARGGNSPVSIGPKQEDPARGGNSPVSIGPKQEDPARGGNSPVSIGPKQEDPARGGTGPVSSLDAKVHAFAGTLSGGEQAAFDWLLQRAATQGQRVGPGGMPAGPAQSMEAAQGRARPGGMPAGPAQTRAAQGQPGPGGMPAGPPSAAQALGLSSIGGRQEAPANVSVLLRF